VENSVYDLQRRWATPVPKMRDLDELNEYLRRCCEQELARTCQRQEQTIGARLEHDRAGAGELPARPFDPCVVAPAKVDKYQTARFDRNRYSVPRSAAYRDVTVKGYIDRVQVVMDGTVVAEHRRDYGREQLILDPLHYLVTLGRRPAALDHAPVYRDWRLPAAFGQLPEHFEREIGATAGARQFVRVLQLLAEHPVERVERAVAQCHRPADAGPIIRRTGQLASRSTSVTEPSSTDIPLDVQVPLPELGQFDELLHSGGPCHE